MQKSSLILSAAVCLALSGTATAADVQTFPVAPAKSVEKPIVVSAPAGDAAPAAAEAPASVPRADALESVVKSLSQPTEEPTEAAESAESKEDTSEVPAEVTEAATDTASGEGTDEKTLEADDRAADDKSGETVEAGSTEGTDAQANADNKADAAADALPEEKAEAAADEPKSGDDEPAGPVVTVGPVAVVPPFLDFMPYVTTLKDVEEVFGKNARLYEEGRYGRRHIITGHDFDLGVTSVLVYYTDTGTVSDVFLRIPADRRRAVLTALRGMTPAMHPDGIWVKEAVDGREFWRTKTTELSVGVPRNGDFTVEYGATARQVRETRAWIDADPEKHCPKFAGLLIGRSTLADLKKRIAGRDCRLIPSAKQEDGSHTYSLTGACFGVPGEYQTLVWTGADDGRITRLFLQSKGDPLGFASVLPALEKRYRPTGREGEFRTADAPARNVWPPLIRFSQKDGSLEFFAGVDGVKKAEAEWDRLLEEKKARDAQAKAVDSLFE